MISNPSIREQLRRRLFLAAQEEVKAVVDILPGPVKQHAKKLPVLFEMTPRPSSAREGIDPDTLGLFSGVALNDSLEANPDGPTQITLYMENIWNVAGRRSADFREEIRRTYLHELGHYLGLDEDDLTARDLD